MKAPNYLPNRVDIPEATSTPVPSAVRQGELSTIGLKMSDGHLYEEIDINFSWPTLLDTCKMMSRDESVYAATNAIKSLIRRVKWEVGTPDADGEKTEEMIEREEYILSCMNDMEQSWADFINEALTMLTFGFSLHEKVYKTRNGYTTRSKYKSKFEDGKIGWAKLAPRSQDTVFKWHYDNKGRSIQYVEQDLSHVQVNVGVPRELPDKVMIPYNKLLHFRFDSQRNIPTGNTPLKSCFVAWKFKTTIAEFEAIGISRDMHGLPCVSLPPEYMADGASEDKKAVYAYWRDVIRNLHMNEMSGIIKPRFIDPETKQDIFGFELIAVDGSKSFDTTAVIDRYENKILMTYMADVLKMGQDSTGSFALSDNKTNLMAIGIEAILKQLLDELNRDLVQQTALMNGWDLSKPLPQIQYDALEARDLDQLGAFVQRLTATGAMEVDQKLSDELRRAADLPITDKDRPIRKDLLTEANQPNPEGVSGPASKGGTGAATQANSNPKMGASKSRGVSN